MITSKLKDYLKFLIINYILYLVVTFLTLTLPIIISAIAYTIEPGGTDTSFWIDPTVFLIPIIFSLRALQFIFKREIIKFLILVPMCYIMIDGFLMLYGYKELMNDYKQIFIHIF